jgi:hypothetical protein
MSSWLDVVQIIISDVIIFPSRGIVQGMGSGVAPMPVQAVLSQSGPGSAKLENLVSRENGDLTRQGLCFSRGDRSLSNRVFVGRRKRNIYEVRRFLQDRFGCMQPDFQIPYGRNREVIVARALLPRVEPRPSVGLDEADRVLDCALGDAGVDRRLNDLRNRAGRGWSCKGKIGRDDPITVPDAVVRCPKLDQSLMISRPLLSRSANARCGLPSASTATIGTMCDSSAPVE